MTPRAVRPDLASRCAAVLLDARLALWVTPVIAAVRIPSTTFTAGGQTLRRHSIAFTTYPREGWARARTAASATQVDCPGPAHPVVRWPRHPVRSAAGGSISPGRA